MFGTCQSVVKYKICKQYPPKNVDLELKAAWKPWFSRVASFSNPSDDPSRLKIDHLLSLGARGTKISFLLAIRNFTFGWRRALLRNGVVAGVVSGQPIWCKWLTWSYPVCSKLQENSCAILLDVSVVVSFFGGCFAGTLQYTIDKYKNKYLHIYI